MRAGRECANHLACATQRDAALASEIGAAWAVFVHSQLDIRRPWPAFEGRGAAIALRLVEGLATEPRRSELARLPTRDCTNQRYACSQGALSMLPRMPCEVCAPSKLCDLHLTEAYNNPSTLRFGEGCRVSRTTIRSRRISADPVSRSQLSEHRSAHASGKLAGCPYSSTTPRSCFRRIVATATRPRSAATRGS